MIVSVASFFLPLVSLDFIVTMSISGFEAIMDSMDSLDASGTCLLLSFVSSVLGLIFAFVGKNNNKFRAGTIVTAIVGMLLMFFALNDEGDFGIKDIDYAGIGFYLYEIVCFLAAVMSGVAMHYYGASANNDVPVHTPSPNPMPPSNSVSPSGKTAQSAKCVCTKCKAEQEKDAAFCRFCGTPINNSIPIPPKPTPAPDPGPNPVPTPTPTPIAKAKDGKVICPHCGARHMMGTTNCKYCGTAIVGTSHAKADPVVVEDPIPAPVYKPISTSKAGRKAVCPHCGARQSEDAINCKYCGTAMK